MSLVTFLGTERPEKHLKMIHKYKAYLSKEQQNEILSEIISLKNLKVPQENCVVSMHVLIEIKEYDTEVTRI